MRSLNKLQSPDILSQNADIWLNDWLNDKNNTTKKYRYREKEIKEVLRIETSNKCIYCESIVGHNTPGDIEHIIPSSLKPTEHFNWQNLSIACTECNRRKNNYYTSEKPFLNPYLDHPIEELVIHYGPIVVWLPNNDRSEITVKTLELNTKARIQLVINKIQKINEFKEIAERYIRENNLLLKEILHKQIISMTNKSSEYSGMILQILEKEYPEILL
ncbi:HNH endonuclease [Leptospira sp. WS39.C2]